MHLHILPTYVVSLSYDISALLLSGCGHIIHFCACYQLIALLFLMSSLHRNITDLKVE